MDYADLHQGIDETNIDMTALMVGAVSLVDLKMEEDVRRTIDFKELHRQVTSDNREPFKTTSQLLEFVTDFINQAGETENAPPRTL